MTGAIVTCHKKLAVIMVVFARRRGRQAPNESSAVASEPGFVGRASVGYNLRLRF